MANEVRAMGCDDTIVYIYRRFGPHMLYGHTAARTLTALALARGDKTAALAYAKASGWDDRDAITSYIKGDVAGMESATALNGAGDAPLDLLLALRPLTLIGRLPLRRVPPMIPMLTGLTGTTAHWNGESKARKMSIGTYSRSSLRLLSVAAMSVASNELLAAQSLDSESAILADLLAACVQALDEAFIDPANTGSAAVPASVTSTANELTAAGSTLANIDEALHAAIASLTTAGSDLRMAYWTMAPAVAAKLALMRGTSGAPAYPQLAANGGVLLGVPVLTSAAITADSDGDQVTLLDAGQIAYTEGTPELRTSQNALIEMSDAPAGATDTPVSAASKFTSMFQEDCTALLSTFFCNFAPRRTGMVALINGLSLSTPASL